VGILRDAAGLARARGRLEELSHDLAAAGVEGRDLRYNLTWHDWLNLSSLVDVSAAICRAAEARTDSRGAHFREDHPETGDLATSAFSRVRSNGPSLELAWQPVRFNRVRPGESLIAS
jgi:fumarate reductase flavoprotein subunit